MKKIFSFLLLFTCLFIVKQNVHAEESQIEVKPTSVEQVVEEQLIPFDVFEPVESGHSLFGANPPSVNSIFYLSSSNSYLSSFSIKNYVYTDYRFQPTTKDAVSLGLYGVASDVSVTVVMRDTIRQREYTHTELTRFGFKVETPPFHNVYFKFTNPNTGNTITRDFAVVETNYR